MGVVLDEPSDAPATGFDEFADSVGGRVRRALVAAYGVEIGSDAAADALAVAWERWPSVSVMDNPAGYLYRIGQSKARPHLRWAHRRGTFPPPASTEPVRDDVLDMFDALRMLRLEERVSVVLAKSYGFSYREIADVLGVSVEAVTNHVHRGLRRLRERLESE